VWWLSGTQTNTQADLSDKRSKYNIQDFSALETINKLKPKSFDVIDDKDVRFEYGFIAQDMELLYPELVNKNNIGYKTINYIELIPLLLSKIKDMQKEIDKLKEHVIV
jgi:hypothetical protein